MTEHGLVVVGSGPAGLSAARAFREHGGRGPVQLVSNDLHPPYNRPPLSKDFLRGEIDEGELALEEPAFYDEREIELLLSCRAVDLDPGRRQVVLEGGRRLDYAACVLATGAVPTVLPVPGADHQDLHLLRTRAHGATLRAAVEGRGSAVVVGSGFIGCEAAASLARRGLRVTVVSAEEHPHASRLGDEVATRIVGWLGGMGVQLVAGRSVESFSDGRTVHLDDGNELTADVVLVAAGVSPQGALAEMAGLETYEGRVLTDPQLRTSAEWVFAAGDVALAEHAAAGRRVPVEHWGDAMTMGEVAGANAAGGHQTWSQAPGFWSEIGDHVLKYSAWGDGYDEARFHDHGDGGFTVWYARQGLVVGVLTHEADQDYERGQALVENGASLSEVG